MIIRRRIMLLWDLTLLAFIAHVPSAYTTLIRFLAASLGEGMRLWRIREDTFI